MFTVILKPRAILMTKEAYEWYEGQKIGLGEEFLDELDRFYRKLELHPNILERSKRISDKLH